MRPETPINCPKCAQVGVKTQCDEDVFINENGATPVWACPIHGYVAKRGRREEDP